MISSSWEAWSSSNVDSRGITHHHLAQLMVTVEDAFTDAWRSFRIRQGDDPATLADPLGRQRRKQKRGKKVNETVDSGGGFFAEAEGEGEASSGGGFVVEEGDEESEDADLVKAKPQHIPLSIVPDALASLSLPTNDDFVLDLFAQTAVHVNNDPRRRKRGVSDASAEKMVSLNDFRRVAQVLLDGEDGASEEDEQEKEEDEDGDGDEGQEEQVDDVQQESSSSSRRRRPVRAAASSANTRRRRQIEQEEAEVEPSESEDAYSEGTAPEVEDEETAEFTQTPTRQARLKKAKTAGSRDAGRSTTGGVRRSRKKARKEETTATDENEEEEEGHLNATQRRTVHAAFRLFTDKLQTLKGQPLDSQPRLGRDDLKMLVKHIGEKIPEKEVDEMIDEGVRFFAKASSRDVTRQTAKLRRDAAAGRAAARGESHRSVTIGIDEFAGILLQGRLI